MLEYAMQHTSEVGEGLELLPGVRNLLEVLSRQDEVVIGLVTGNLEDIAWLKMEGLGILHYFSVPNFGGFGSDHTDRGELVRIAAARAEQLFPGGFRCRAHVGDTREQVEELAASPSTEYPIVCNNLKKVYPARDGNPPKYAVNGFSLAVPKGECFGILGPNGAGKTSSINMMIGFLKPSSGTAYIQRMDIRTEMDRIYSSMGVCPQHDLLWGQLTGREHLLFYSSLKNLKGTELFSAVESSLRSVNIWDNGVADKQCRKFSGGMKRRLSVAISLIGNPQVVYMDTPITGLDPVSRYNLWSVIKQSKQDRAIILTSSNFSLLCSYKLGASGSGI